MVFSLSINYYFWLVWHLFLKKITFLALQGKSEWFILMRYAASQPLTRAESARLPKMGLWHVRLQNVWNVKSKQILNGKLEEPLTASRQHETFSCCLDRIPWAGQFILAIGARGISPSWWEAWKQSGLQTEQEAKDPILNHKQQELQVRCGYKTLTPELREVFPRARPPLPNLSKQCQQLIPSVQILEPMRESSHSKHHRKQNSRTLGPVLGAAAALF